METKIKAAIEHLTLQRNQALDVCAQMAGEIAQRDERISELQQELAALRTDVDGRAVLAPTTPNIGSNQG